MWTNWRGDELERLVNAALCRAIEKTGHVILQASQSEVPLDESTLMKSGIVRMAANNVPVGCISYGGGSGTGFPIVPYARRWHENPANFQHGRKRFYLRDPFNRIAQQTLNTMIAQEMREVL
jgi:hypothetical protein